MSCYGSLKEYAFWWPGPGNPYVNGDITTAKHGGSRTIPGKFGALASPLLEHLSPDHNDVELTDEEIRRITLWIDCNSNELGACVDVANQRRGQLVWPEIDCDPEHPNGVEYDRPLSGVAQVKRNISQYLTENADSRRITVSFNAARRMLSIANCPEGPVNIAVYNAAGRCLWRKHATASLRINRRITGIPRFGSGMVIVSVEDATDNKTVFRTYRNSR
jgi:hypothetical protein